MAPPLTPPTPAPSTSVVQSCPLGYDTRKIVVAYGVGHRPTDGDKNVLVNLLNNKGLTPKATPRTNGFQYDARAHHPALYDVKYVYTKADFVKYLQDPEVHLIYCGHSRGGLGPCFFDRDTLEIFGGEHWGDQGIFKMGFDYCALPTEDMVKHKYTAHPLPGTTQASTLDANKCQPRYLRPFLGSAAARTTGAPPKVPTASYLAFDAPNKESANPGNVEWLVVAAGAEEFMASSPKARVLCLFSCDTEACFKPIVQQKSWLGADSGFVYHTSAVNSPTSTTMWWLFHLFTYSAPRATGCTPWKPSLDYALAQANAELSKKGKSPNPVLAKGWSIVP